jgi:hypothetical protein
MKTRILIAATVLLGVAATLSGQELTFTATYTADSGHEPAEIPVDTIDPARSIIRLEEGPSTTMHEVNFYFVKGDGTSDLVTVTTYTYPIYERFLHNPELLQEYERIEVYYNGEKGSSPFNQGSITITIEDRPFVEAVLDAPISYSADGKVQPAVFEMAEVEGADFVWVEMSSGQAVDLVVRARNPETGLSKSFSGNQIGFTGGSMSRAYETIYGSEPTGREAGVLLENPLGLHEPGKFTQVEVSLDISAGSGDEGDEGDEGTVYLTSLTAQERRAIAQSVQEESDAYDAAWTVTFWLWGAALVGGYLLTRLVYRSLAKSLAEVRLLGFIPLTWLVAAAVIPAWYAVVRLVWLSPLVPGNDPANLYIMNTSVLFIFLVVALPMLLDRRYNLCRNCKSYGTITLGGRETAGGTTTTYTASNRHHTIVTGEDKREFYNDQYVCTNCGHIRKRAFGVFSGRGRQSADVQSDGRLATTDVISAGGILNVALTLAQPYNWYRFYRAIGLAR